MDIVLFLAQLYKYNIFVEHDVNPNFLINQEIFKEKKYTLTENVTQTWTGKHRYIMETARNAL